MRVESIKSNQKINFKSGLYHSSDIPLKFIPKIHSCMDTFIKKTPDDGLGLFINYISDAGEMKIFSLTKMTDETLNVENKQLPVAKILSTHVFAEPVNINSKTLCEDLIKRFNASLTMEKLSNTEGMQIN